jgi:hypothetical protein
MHKSQLDSTVGSIDNYRLFNGVSDSENVVLLESKNWISFATCAWIGKDSQGQSGDGSGHENEIDAIEI